MLLDSGIRTGADVFIALALGADSVLLGRPYMYGLAIAGQRGIEEVIRNIVAELDLTMALTGARSIKDIDARFVRPSPRSQPFRDRLDGGQAAFPLGADGLEAARGVAQLSADHPVRTSRPTRTGSTRPTSCSTARCLAMAWRVTGSRPARAGRRRVALAERCQDAPPGLVAERGEHRDQRLVVTAALEVGDQLVQFVVPAAAVALHVGGRVGRVSKPVSTTVSCVPPWTGSSVKRNTVEWSSSTSSGVVGAFVAPAVGDHPRRVDSSMRHRDGAVAVEGEGAAGADADPSSTAAPNQRAMCSGSVIAAHTFSRGAAMGSCAGR